MRRWIAGCLVAALAAALVACWHEEEPRPIVVRQDRVSVTNMTNTTWTNVDLWLNDFYRAQVPSLAAGQRVDVPLDVFTQGWGQRFNPKKQAPVGIEVTAAGLDGKPVRLTWGKGRRR